MNESPLLTMTAVQKAYRFFALRDIDLRLAPGQIVGLIGPNGAGKSTTLRILMGLVRQDAGAVRLLGRQIPGEDATAKLDVGFVSEDMRLYGANTLGWHMRMVAAIYPGWDDGYASVLLERFGLRTEQTIRGLSHGERTKAILLLVLARRPRLLVLDEPTTGLDPVARHEILAELMDVIGDENRGVLFSSQNTVDVEQISDVITFIDRGRVVESSDKEGFLERWRRLQLDVPDGTDLPQLNGVVEIRRDGRSAILTTNAFAPALCEALVGTGCRIGEVQRMTLEEIFVATVMASRREVAQ